MAMDYVAEKFWESLRCLASGDQPEKTRLRCAATSLITLKEEDFPDDFRKQFQNLMYSLTADPRNSKEGSIKTTNDTMSDKKVEETIELIIHLYTKVVRLAPDWLNWD
jgi:hypothetical protein